MNSYEKINYSLRPSKAIERKMLSELMSKLNVFDSLQNYKYIGFGSIYFTDFSLFHKTLGIEKMLSMESDKVNEDRFRFNLPYSCVDLEFKPSSEALPELDWNSKSIVWLDYDVHLNTDVIEDIRTVSMSIQSGSLYFLSVNANVDDDRGKQEGYRLEQLEKRIGRDKVPNDIGDRDLNKIGLPKTYYKIINDEIQAVLQERNSGENDDNKFVFKQLIHIIYKDGALMLTIGGLFIQNKDLKTYNLANFENLEFIRKGTEAFEIIVPKLTYKEITFLNNNFHKYINKEDGEFGEGLINPSIPKQDIIEFMKIYRYFPTYAEAFL